eukprot:gene9202-19080_t
MRTTTGSVHEDEDDVKPHDRRLQSLSNIFAGDRRHSTENKLMDSPRRAERSKSRRNVVSNDDLLSSFDIDIKMVAASLESVNPFLKRHNMVALPMLHIPSTGESTFQSMSLRDLYQEVHRSVLEADALFFATLAKQQMELEDISNKDGQHVDSPTGEGINHDNGFETVKDIHSHSHSSSPEIIQSPSPSSLPRTFSRVNVNYPGGHMRSDPTVLTRVALKEYDQGAAIQLRIRDLRRLELSLDSQEEEPAVLVRRHAVLIALDPIRSVVMADKVVLIVPPGADSLLTILEKHMKEWSPESIVDGVRVTVPFELHAYEAILATVKALQTQEYERLKDEVTYVVRHMKGGSILPIELQEKLRDLKNNVSQMVSKIEGYRRALNESPLSSEILVCHEEIEDLFQAYLMDYNTLGSHLDYLRTQIQSAEELASLRLDTSRNELLIVNTNMAVLAASIGVGTYIAGIFGMNLDNTLYIQNVEGTFAIVWVGSTLLIMFMFAMLYSYFVLTGAYPKRVVMKPKKTRGGE